MVAVILAGGKSRRMGRDKALLPFKSENLLSDQIRRFQKAGFSVAVSQHEVRNEDVLVIPDHFPGSGPLAGLHAAFAETGEALLFLSAVDLPLADPRLAAIILREIRDGEDACVIRRRSGEIEPLFAAYRRSCLPVAEAMLREGQGKMQTLLSRVKTRFLEEDSLPDFDLSRILLNLNLPEDYRRLTEK